MLARHRGRTTIVTLGTENIDELHIFVANGIASGRRNGAIFAGHGGTSRKELQKSWEEIAAIPYHQYRDEAKEMARHYQGLLEEDRGWVEPNADALAKMTAEQKVAYWLYHLRDLDVGQFSDPGWCYVLSELNVVFGVLDKKKPNAAVELEKLGMAAVPQLIAHLDDARPTRCKGHWRSYWPEDHYLLRYGDCCQQIFESITRRHLFKAKLRTPIPIQDNKGKECKENAERRWQDYQKKGERQVLIEATMRGDRDSHSNAERLLKKFPEAAFEAIAAGIKKSSEGRIRSNLVACLCELKDERVTGFLLEELKGPNLQARIHAARGLMDRDRLRGIRSPAG